MNIYDWLKEKQLVVTPSGVSYEITKFREAVDYIDQLHKELDMHRNLAAEENERLNRQRDMYEYGGGKHLGQIQMDIADINKNIQEVSRLLIQLIDVLKDQNG